MKFSILSFILSLPLYAAPFAVEYPEFIELKKVAIKVYDKLKPSVKYTLHINKQPSTYFDEESDEEQYWWNLDVNNASFFQYEKEGKIDQYITVFGGFGKQEFMDPDALAVTICHEIAHGIGGEPYKVNGTTTEGQADYFATKECLPLFYEIYKPLNPIQASSGYIDDLCQREDSRGDKDYCVRAMNALHADMKFFKLLGESSYYDRASQSRPLVFDTGATHYPDAQCRVDLMVHGILGLERPICFDPNGIERVL